MERLFCIICGEKDLELLINLKNFPIEMACTDRPQTSDEFLDMRWEICRGCGNIQLRNLVPIEKLYVANHNDAVGKTWQDHNVAFSRFISLFKPFNVMEIGGGSGKIAKLSLESSLFSLNSWMLAEPNPILDFENPKLHLLKSWLQDLTAAQCAEIDTVVHSHVMEHFYVPDNEVRRMAELFRPGHRMIFSLPNLDEWLRAKFFNALMFEHSFFLNSQSLTYLMNKNGYQLVASEAFRNHSIFYCFESRSPLQVDPPRRYRENKDIFSTYIEYCRSESKKIAEKIATLPLGTPVYLFGAHIFAQMLLHFGVPENSIENILDNSKAKIGRRLYGHSLSVRPPESIAKLAHPAVVLRAGPYDGEIARQLKSINSDVQII